MDDRTSRPDSEFAAESAAESAALGLIMAAERNDAEAAEAIVDPLDRGELALVVAVFANWLAFLMNDELTYRRFMEMVGADDA
jgi:hypothetical protein